MLCAYGLKAGYEGFVDWIGSLGGSFDGGGKFVDLNVVSLSRRVYLI